MRRSIGLLALSALLTLSLVPSGGAAKHNARVATAQFPAARPVAMTDTPRSLLSFCRENDLLRPMCPTRLPAWGSGRPAAPGYYCQTRHPNQTVRQTRVSFAGKRCLFAEWSFVAGLGLPGWAQSARAYGWDGRRWVGDEWSMSSPPLHVGVDIQASHGPAPDLSRGSVAAREPAHTPTDSLLGPSRSQAVSLGWVRWYGHSGQLVLTPWGPCEQGDGLLLYLPPNAHGVSYTITLDAWMPALRLVAKRTDRQFRFQPGPALPHVIATLKAIVGSVLSGRAE